MLEMISMLSYTGLAPCHEVSENSLKFVSMNGMHNVTYFSLSAYAVGGLFLYTSPFKLPHS
jgi:hypothetical protein